MIGAVLDASHTEDVYVGIATRQDDTSGALANCLHLPALFVDLDFKTLPEAEARHRLATARPRPSLFVASGGGLHVYWTLDTPIDLSVDAANAKTLLRRVARVLTADLAAAEPARILRVPGTLNHKYEPPRPVTLERCDA